MKFTGSTALGLLLALNGAMAAPVDKRAVHIVTVTQQVTEVVSVTSTVWVPYGSYATSTYEPEPTVEPTSVEDLSTSLPTSEIPLPTTSAIETSSVETAAEPTYTPEPTSTEPSTTPESTFVEPTTSSEPTTSLEPVTTTTPTPAVTSTPELTYEPSTTAVEISTTVSIETPTAASYSVVDTATSALSSFTNTGEATFYNTGMGSCGITSTDSEMVVALSHELMDADDTGNSNTNPNCGRKIECTIDGSTVITVTIVDRCVGCKIYDLDFSPSAFEALGYSLGTGRANVKWRYVD